MSQLGIGLSVMFSVFMAVMAVVYYAWRSRQRRRAVESRRARSSNATAASSSVAAQNWPNWTTWLDIARHGVNWTALRAKKAKRLAELRLHSIRLRRPIVSKPVRNGCVMGAAPPLEAIEESEEAGDDDIFNLGGFLIVPHLLFTITEETEEEMQDLLEGVRSAQRSRGRASNASGELVFVTPPSSPPFATPFRSAGPLLPTNTFTDFDATSTSSSTPFSSPPNNRRTLRALLEETSSFSSSSATSTFATPATIWPPLPPPLSPASPKHQRRLDLLLEHRRPSPIFALYRHHNRVHPLSPPSFRPINIDGNPILGSFQ